MKNVLKKTVAAVLVISAFSGIASADYDISVRMDNIISEGSRYVYFDEVKPIQIDSRTLIPARAVAEAAGMNVMWDQPTQTAILTLTADADSSKPIERFAAQLIGKIDTAGLDLTPVDITAALKLEDSTAVIRFNFIDSEGDYVPFGMEYDMVSKAILIDDGTLMIPIRDSMEMFGLSVGWNQDQLCAYVSIPKTPYIPENLKVIPNPGQGEYVPTGKNSESYVTYSYSELKSGGDGRAYSYSDAAQTAGLTSDTYSYTDIVSGKSSESDGNELGEYMGTFKITHYCPCNICNGGWGDNTAWAGKIIPGQTIGVNPNVIAPLSWVYVDGYGWRRAEDTGSGIGVYHIDMAVPVHSMVTNGQVVYRDVYKAK